MTVYKVNIYDSCFSAVALQGHVKNSSYKNEAQNLERFLGNSLCQKKLFLEKPIFKNNDEVAIEQLLAFSKVAEYPFFKQYVSRTFRYVKSILFKNSSTWLLLSINRSNLL